VASDKYNEAVEIADLVRDSLEGKKGTYSDLTIKSIRMKEADEQIEEFYERKKNNYWEKFSFLQMCKWLYPYQMHNLMIHGQVNEELFLRANLNIIFPHLTYEAIDNGFESEDERLAVDINGNEVHQILHPLPIYKKFVSMLYHELNKKYRDDSDLLNLKESSDEISKLIKSGGIGVSQPETIASIDRALNSKSPGGPIWIRCQRKK